MGAAVLPCDSIAPWVDRADAAGDERVRGVPDSVLADLISRGAKDDAPLWRYSLGHLDEPVGVVHCRRELGRRDLDGDRVGVEVRLRLGLRARAGASVRVGVGVGLGIGLELGRRDLDGAHRVYHEATHIGGHVILVIELAAEHEHIVVGQVADGGLGVVRGRVRVRS